MVYSPFVRTSLPVMTLHEFYATTAKHLENLLADELRDLGASKVREGVAVVRFEADMATAYRICLWSRVANSVLRVLGRFPAATPEELYDAAQRIDWAEHFSCEQTFAVTFHSNRSAIRHSHFGALKVKDAVVDQFRERTGERPSVATDKPDVHINVYVQNDEATLSLDLSGESLHRRAYRAHGASAPLKETLAAAILLRAGWPQIAAEGGNLVDPMCGSGTLPIEAALMAADIAPGLLRSYWGFSHWHQHDSAIWDSLLEEARQRRDEGLGKLQDIRGYDGNPQAVRIALENIERAGLRGHVHVEKRDLAEATPARPDDTGLVVVNPPYGERLGKDNELPALYARLGQTLKEHFPGWRATMITSNLELGKKTGIRARRKHKVYNGALECVLLHFEIQPEWFMSERRLPRPIAAEQRSEGSNAFANRLKKNHKHLKRWLTKENIKCYRLYDADIPEFAVAVDVYENDSTWLHVQEYEAPKNVDEKKARLRLREILGVLLDHFQLDEEKLFLKLRKQQKGSAQYEKLDASRHFHQVMENDCRFLVNFTDYLDTGLFLDHRPTRQMIAEQAAGKRFLNLFAYTGSGTVYAAKGGARSTTTVDMSNTYLDWARENMHLNGFTGDEHEFVRADCLEWLEQAMARRRQFDLIFLDPPSFSTSKKMKQTFDIQRDHVALLTKTMQLLTANGLLIFSNNLRRFKMDLEAMPAFHIENISAATLPRDFERNPRIHNCWTLRHKA